MCTAIRFQRRDCYFGRNLDLDVSYGEEVCILPRHFPLDFGEMGEMRAHYAMIGMATVVGGIPLFYDAANEHGLGMAGLNFPGNAYYPPRMADKDNVPPFAFIPWILGQCRTVAEARVLLGRINLVDIPFSEKLPLSPLHWMLADATESIVVESMRDGLHIYDNPVGVMSNNPPFPAQLANLETYRDLRVDNAGAVCEPAYYCQGLGAVGLPGDVSSMSRFVRAAFGCAHAVCADDEASAVGQFFHLLTSVGMVRGLCRTDAGTWDITGYSACMNLTRGLYYYTTYDNRRISRIDLHRTDLDAETVSRYPLKSEQDFDVQN